MIKTSPWYLDELRDIPKNNKTVFSCFHCGGGSTMGYKLAGYDVLGGVEIDKKMVEVYCKNHHPKYSYLMDIKEFNKLSNAALPRELFQLDILDGSPPCSPFSMNGRREAGWGVKKKFREGQTKQVLDDLFFNFISTANLLKPKVVISENVKGLIIGKAKGYVKEILKKFDEAGYNTQIFLLNSAFMGVPQTRERVIFISVRKDLNKKKLNLCFHELIISIQQAFKDIDYSKETKNPLTGIALSLWGKCKPGESFSSVASTGGSWFTFSRLSKNKPSRTLTTGGTSGDGAICHFNEPRKLTKTECIRIQTFPDDYNFIDAKPYYITGMSVPPFMMQRIALAVYDQLLKDN